METRIIMLGIIIGLIGFGVGFAVGVTVTINKGVHLAKVLIIDKNLNITFSEEVLSSLIRRYIGVSDQQELKLRDRELEHLKGGEAK